MTNGAQVTEKTIVVLGAPRGGTSLMAGTLRELGVHMGRNLGKNHEDSSFLSKDADKIRDVIEKRNREHKLWGFKVPHAISYLPKVHAHLINPHFVVIIRHPLAAARSQVRRSPADIQTGLAVTAEYYRRIGRFFKDHDYAASTLWVSMEDALASPRKFVRQLAEFCGVVPDCEQVNNAVDFVDPATGYTQIKAYRWDVQLQELSEVSSRREEWRPVYEAEIEGSVRQRFGLDKPASVFDVEIHSVKERQLIFLVDQGHGLNANDKRAVRIPAGFSRVNFASNSPIEQFGLRISAHEQSNGLTIYRV